MEPLDAWQEEGLHYFTFALASDTIGVSDEELPVAVFIIDGETSEIVSAVTVTPLPETGEARIEDLRNGHGEYTVTRPGSGA